MSHPCPAPTCGRSIMDNRWCCTSCWYQLSSTARQGVKESFTTGSAETYLAAVKTAMDELTQLAGSKR